MTREKHKEIIDYHDYHGDKDVRVVRTIYDDHNLPAALVRIGSDVSCIDALTDYVVEMDSCKRADEDEMVQRYETGIEFEEARTDERLCFLRG